MIEVAVTELCAGSDQFHQTTLDLVEATSDQVRVAINAAAVNQTRARLLVQSYAVTAELYTHAEAIVVDGCDRVREVEREIESMEERVDEALVESREIKRRLEAAFEAMEQEIESNTEEMMRKLDEMEREIDDWKRGAELE